MLMPKRVKYRKVQRFIFFAAEIFTFQMFNTDSIFEH